MVRSLLFCVTLCTLLTACGKPEVQIVERPVPVPVHVPEYLRSCPEVPVPGVTDATDQADVADYILRLYGVASDCHTKLDSVDGILDQYEAQTETEKIGFPPL